MLTPRLKAIFRSSIPTCNIKEGKARALLAHSPYKGIAQPYLAGLLNQRGRVCLWAWSYYLFRRVPL